MRQRRPHSKGFCISKYALLGLVLFLLTSCSVQGGSAAGSTNTGGKDPSKIYIGFISETTSQDFALEMALLVTQSNVQQIIKRQASQAAKGQFYQPIIDQEFADPTAYIKPLAQAT